MWNLVINLTRCRWNLRTHGGKQRDAYYLWDVTVIALIWKNSAVMGYALLCKWFWSMYVPTVNEPTVHKIPRSLIWTCSQTSAIVRPPSRFTPI